MNSKSKIPIDIKSPDEIKEKAYITRQIDTSITLLSSKEDDIVMEALLYLSKYADLKRNNFVSLQNKGILSKLLILIFSKNICTLRLALRLLSNLLRNDTRNVMLELDKESNDEYILTISQYIEHNDLHVRNFSVLILAIITKSTRINSLILTPHLLNNLLQTIKVCKDLDLLLAALALFTELLSSPEALVLLPTLEDFNCAALLMHLQHPDQNVVRAIFDIFIKLTQYNIDVFQKMFDSVKLVEKMLMLIIEPDYVFVSDALTVVVNCMKSEYTNRNFIESFTFLKFCQWINSCHHKYLPQCANILKELSKIPEIKQTLFDLSVEVSILNLLRSTSLEVLNDACEAISNMSVHRYCCETMLTTSVLRCLMDILIKEDRTVNLKVLRTISDFSRRATKFIPFLYGIGAHMTLYSVFLNYRKDLAEEDAVRLLEIVYKLSLKPLVQQDLVSEAFFEDLLNIVSEDYDEASILCCELFAYFIKNDMFYNAFTAKNGSKIILDKLKTTRNFTLFKTIMMYLYACTVDEDMICDFIRKDIAPTLKNLPSDVKQKSPIIERVLALIYDVFLPLKFYQYDKIDITDTLNNKFYLIKGDKDPSGNFPLLENLLSEPICPHRTVYVVDYSYPVVYAKANGGRSLKHIESNFPIPGCTLTDFHPPADDITPDPYLPRYIHHMTKELDPNMDMREKIFILANYVDTLLCGADEDNENPPIHTLLVHLAALKTRLNGNVIPIGFLRIGGKCERSLLFKAIADRLSMPCSLLRRNDTCWNEVAMLDENNILRFYVIDLINDVGNLLPRETMDAKFYCSSNEK